MRTDLNEPIDTRAIRADNRRRVLAAVRAGSTSRADLARVLGLAKPTVSAIVDELVADGTVREGEALAPRSRRPGSRGRPPVRLSFNGRHAFVVGIHVGVVATTVVLADAAGAELRRRRIATPGRTGETALAEIGALAREVVVTAGIPRRRLAAATAAVPGAVDHESGTCLQAPGLGWRDVPVGGLLRAALGVPVTVRNAVHAAAVAEAAEGAGREARTMALVWAGSGVGAAVVTSGRLDGGAHGMAGELGHAAVPGLDASCRCGRHGCVETGASAPAVARAARDAIATGTPTRLSALGDDVTPLDVYAAAEAGDTLAQALLAEAGRTLGVAASWLVNLVDPDVLVVAGGLTNAGSHVVDPFRATLDGSVGQAVLDRLVVRTGSLGGEAKVRGAVLVALEGVAR